MLSGRLADDARDLNLSTWPLRGVIINQRSVLWDQVAQGGQHSLPAFPSSLQTRWTVKDLQMHGVPGVTQSSVLLGMSDTKYDFGSMPCSSSKKDSELR